MRVNTVLPGYIWGPSLEWFFGYLAEKQGATILPLTTVTSVEPRAVEPGDVLVVRGNDLHLSGLSVRLGAADLPRGPLLHVPFVRPCPPRPPARSGCRGSGRR